MNRQECPPLDVLRAFATGDLPETELDGLADHFHSCRLCEDRLAEFDDAADTLLVNLRCRMMAGSGTATATGSVTSPAHDDGRHSDMLPPGEWSGSDFRIIRELGRGGMGTVYEAVQDSLNRHVALKLLPERGDLARFRREAKAAGRLHHTNIVPVFGVGEHRGRHFYLMQFIAGRGLDVLLKERRARSNSGAREPRDYRAAARIGTQAAEALAYAHAQGVIHRDIKPSNILLDERGTVWITDFGLAHDSADDVTLTESGAIVGTLKYLAPERISGRGDARADIYGLGVSLYELIIGDPPFGDSDRARLLNQVLHHEPRRPRQIDPQVPRDLETIVLKAMARDPDQRYATARELADDLRRYLDDRPIQTRRAGVWERSVRWCRRNPVVAGLLAALLVVFLTGFAGVTIEWRRANSEAIRASALALRANAEAHRANQTARAEAIARAAESALRIKAQTEVATNVLEKGLALARQGDVGQGALWMAEALRQAPAERPDLVRMAQANLTAWCDDTPALRAMLEHRGRISAAVFRADGKAILTGSFDGTAQLWDSATGKPLGPAMNHGHKVYDVALSPDGRLAVTAGFDHRLVGWDVETFQPRGALVVDHGQFWHAAFSPDGHYLVSGGSENVANLWNMDSGTLIAATAPHDGTSRALAFSPDSRLALTTGGTFARLSDPATGDPVGSPMRHDREVLSVSFSPDGRVIATCGDDGRARLWDGRTGAPLGRDLDHGAGVWRAVFSPDNRSIMTAGRDGAVRFWDVATGRPLCGRQVVHTGEITQAAFSPDGKLALTGGDDSAVWLWDAATGRPLGSHLRHRLPITTASFSPDGTLVLTASEDGTAKLWDLRRPDGELAATGEVVANPHDAAGPGIPPAPGVTFATAAFTADRSLVLLGSHNDGLARLVATATGQPVGLPIKLRWPIVRAMTFTPDGRRFAIAGHDRPFAEGGGVGTTCQVWDTATCLPVSPLMPDYNWVAALSFRPDGKMLATGGYGAAMHLWDASTGAPIGGSLRAGTIVVRVAFSPDGQTLAAGMAETSFQVVLWNVATGQPLGQPIQFRQAVHELAFSPDGKRLAAGSLDGTARLIDVPTVTGIGEPLAHSGGVTGVAFSPDGRLLLTVNGAPGATSAARLWDAQSGQAASPVMSHPREISARAIAFHPDGKSFATGCVDGSVRLWDVATARQAGPPWTLRHGALAIAFGPDGRSLLAVDNHGCVRTLPLPEFGTEPIDRLIGRVNVRTGLEMDEAREVTTLLPESWRQRRDDLSDGTETSGGASEPAWHEACARDAEAIGARFTARWHLARLIADRPADGPLHARLAMVLFHDDETASAEAELARALKLGPRERLLDWLAHQAENFQAAGRPRDAVRLLDVVIAARPQEWRLYALRAEALAALGHASLGEADLDRAVDRGGDVALLFGMAEPCYRAGRYARAADLYDRAIAQGTVPYELWQQCALAHLEIDDRVGFQKICATLRSRYPAAVPDAWVRYYLASACVLGDGGVGDDGKAVRWAEDLLAALPPGRKELRHAGLHIVGGLLYRSGRYRDAIDRLNEGIAAQDGAAFSEDFLYLALAYHRLNDSARARSFLAAVPPDDPITVRDRYWDCRALPLLVREAARVILDPDMPADPFAP